jgi:hypothetical protein
MLELIALIIAVAGLVFGGICLVDYNHQKRKVEIDEFMVKYERLLQASERRRNASEMATIIRIIENECKR